MQIKKWTCGEITFTSNDNYENPFNEVDLNVSFTSENGTVLLRPAFWDGGNTWRVRFAPTELGKWKYKTHCSNKRDTGLDGISGEIECIPYDGELEIYKHGFLKVSENKRYFTYNDGTPFFYLGDTHWLMPREHFDDSNVEGIDSQFKFCVDYRLTQGFTVYQSEPLSSKSLNFNDGFDESDVEDLNFSIDRKFKYVAEKGLVHTNAMLYFAPTIQYNCYHPEYLVKLTKMWCARFGAYPVMWTLGQEVDPDFYNCDMTRWLAVGEALYIADCYKHPLTAHMCNDGRCHPNTTIFGNKYFHSWFGMQPQYMRNSSFEEFYNYKITKPIINYETGYEHLWNSDEGALNAGYRSFFNGAFGYGYGAHGVWNGNNDIVDWMAYGGYMRWFEGMLLPGAKKLWFMKNFYESFDWYNLKPVFDDKEFWDVPASMTVSTLGNDVFVFDYTAKSAPVTLKKLTEKQYSLLIFSPDNGEITDMGTIMPENGVYTIAPKETHPARVCILATDKEKYLNRPLSISSESLETLLNYKGCTLKLKANKPCSWETDDSAIATVDENGVLTAMGKNGLVKVKAISGDETAERLFLCVRQDKTEKPFKGEKIKLHVKPISQPVDTCVIKSPDKFVDVLPEFVPANVWNQNGSCVVTDENGKEAAVFRIANNVQLIPMFDGKCKIKFISDEGLESDTIDFEVKGYGSPSLTFGADCTCDDYHPFYDPRCCPQRAVNGETACFTGWCSEKTCSEENPAILTVTLKEKHEINRIDLFTTDQGYMLKGFDIYLVNGDKSVCVAHVRDNKTDKPVFTFEKFETEKIRVVCTQGDGSGNARIDQINAYSD